MFTTPERVYGPHQRPRRESYLKWANLIVWLFSAIAFVVTVQQVTQKAWKTVDDFWLPGTWALDSSFEATLHEAVVCNMTKDVAYAGWDVPFLAHKDSVQALMAHTAALIRRSMWITGSAVALSGVNKLLFERNVHRFAMRESTLSLPRGHLLFLEVCGIIWSIVALEEPQTFASYLRDYLKECSTNKVNHVFNAPPFTVMYAAHGVTLALHLATFVMLLHNLDPPGRQPAPRLRKRIRALFSIVMLRKRTAGGLSRAPKDPDAASAEDALVEYTSAQLLSCIRQRLHDEQPPPPPPTTHPAGSRYAPSAGLGGGGGGDDLHGFDVHNGTQMTQYNTTRGYPDNRDPSGAASGVNVSGVVDSSRASSAAMPQQHLSTHPGAQTQPHLLSTARSQYSEKNQQNTVCDGSCCFTRAVCNSTDNAQIHTHTHTQWGSGVGSTADR